MTTRRPTIGGRITLQYRDSDGVARELIGWVAQANPDGLVVLDRQGDRHRLAWPAVVVWRNIGVPRGRHPKHTSRAELDQLAGELASRERCFVARLSDLLDARTPPPLPPVPDQDPEVRGEWALVAAGSDLLAQCWSASRRDARNVQARTDQESEAERLLAFGFTEVAHR